MLSLLLDRDVQAFLLLLLSAFLISILNKYKLKYKVGIRFIIGAIILSLGISNLILGFLYLEFSPTNLAAIIILFIVGLSIMLIKAKKNVQQTFKNTRRRNS